MTGAPSDTDLMKRIAAGEALAFRQLASRHLNRAHAIAMRVVHNREDAEEAVQDALSRVWQHASRFEPERSAFSTWFYRILANAALDRLRRRPPSSEAIDVHEDSLADSSATPEETWTKAGEANRVQAAIATLPPNQRLAVALCYYEDFTQPDAARIMNIHLKALEALLFRAKTTLKRSLT